MNDYENFNNTRNTLLTVGDWFVMLLLISIPIVNIILLLVWAFSSDTHPTKKNFAKAILLWGLVSIVIAFALGACGMFATFSVLG